jgi:hypothetical protein
MHCSGFDGMRVESGVAENRVSSTSGGLIRVLEGEMKRCDQGLHDARSFNAIRQKLRKLQPFG